MVAVGHGGGRGRLPPGCLEDALPGGHRIGDGGHEARPGEGWQNGGTRVRRQATGLLLVPVTKTQVIVVETLGSSRSPWARTRGTWPQGWACAQRPHQGVRVSCPAPCVRPGRGQPRQPSAVSSSDSVQRSEGSPVLPWGENLPREASTLPLDLTGEMGPRVCEVVWESGCQAFSASVGGRGF